VATMLIRLAIAICASIQLVSACDCIRLSVKDAKRGSRIVFRGTVVAMHESAQRFPVATFKVVRVWKGNVSETFEMFAFQEVSGSHGWRSDSRAWDSPKAERIKIARDPR